MSMTIYNNTTIGKGGNIMLTGGCNSIPQVSIDQLNGYRSLFVGLEKLGLSSNQVAALAYERYSTCARVLSEHLELLEDFVNAGEQLHADDERAISTFFVKHTKLVLDLLHKWEVPPDYGDRGMLCTCSGEAASTYSSSWIQTSSKIPRKRR